MIDLGGDVAVAVNDSGQVVGVSNRRAFSWTQAGGMIDLGTLGDSYSEAKALNANGQVVGWSFSFGDFTSRAVLWQPIANLGCNATLAGCNLKGANLAGAYLKDRDLSDANLTGANLTNANLAAANLTDTNLKEANLTNANLAGANVNGANVKDVIWSNTICPDGTNSDANGGTCVQHL